jgi:putative ABC transport system permease protein
VGDTFYLESFIPPYRRREGPFEFVVRGIYDADKVRDPAADNRVMYFHHKYLYEGTGRRTEAGIYVVELSDPSQAATVAKSIDALFENSDAATKSETEAAFRADFIALIGNLGLLLNSIGLAVIFTILLVTANTMSMAVRERRTEIAVLKTLGFSSGQVMGLILSEAVIIGALGGAIGLGLAAFIVGGMTKVPGMSGFVNGLPNFGLHWQVSTEGLAMAVFIGLSAGFIPALSAYRSRITEMLRQI